MKTGNNLDVCCREDGMSSVDIKSETDSLRPDSPKCGDTLLSSEYPTLYFTKNGHTLTSEK